MRGARLLLEQLRPAVNESLAGRWGYGHLRVVEKELGDIPEPLRAEVFDDVLPFASIDHPRRLTERIRIRAPYVTIDGSSAPGDGVCIAGGTVAKQFYAS